MTIASHPEERKHQGAHTIVIAGGTIHRKGKHLPPSQWPPRFSADISWASETLSNTPSARARRASLRGRGSELTRVVLTRTALAYESTVPPV